MIIKRPGKEPTLKYQLGTSLESFVEICKEAVALNQDAEVIVAQITVHDELWVESAKGFLAALDNPDGDNDGYGGE